jgi:CubicO group peptidase (beta-lactamase class C family)
MECADEEGRMPWFGRKRFGWGLRPISWQGWSLTIAYVVIVLTLGATLASSQGWLFGTIFAIVTALYLVVAYLTRE